MDFYHNGEVKTLYKLKQSFKHISFPASGPDSQWMTDNNVLEVESWPTIDPNSQIIEKVAGPEVNGKWRTYSLRNKTVIEKQTELIPMVKAEARKRIIAIIPEWKQSNLNARMNELNKKVAIDGGTLTAEEQSEVTAMAAIWAQAKAIRAKSDVLEASIVGMTLEQLNALDVTDNSHWV